MLPPEFAGAHDALDLSGTFIEPLPTAIANDLLTGSVAFARLAGALIFDIADPRPHVGLVLSGTTRSYLTATDGRQLTVRYSRRGAIIGKRSDLSGDHAPLSVRAVTGCHILEFDADRLERLVETDVAVAHAIVGELTGRLEDVYSTVADVVFGSIRQRVVRHLLALAEASGDGPAVVTVTQQQLGDGIGSPREVVARELARLRHEGLVRTGGGSIVILDRGRLGSFLGEWLDPIRVPIPGAIGVRHS